MFTRILVASAVLAALATAPAQAGPKHKFLFDLCKFGFQTQCALTSTHGDDNTATIEQDQWGPGLQLGIEVQHGNNNNAYTGQRGTNEVALTVQNGNDNRSGIHQDGQNLGAVTVQNSNGAWHTTSMAGNGGVVVAYQSN